VKRHPLEVTVDRLWDHIAKYDLQGGERDVLTETIEILERKREEESG